MWDKKYTPVYDFQIDSQHNDFVKLPFQKKSKQNKAKQIRQ
jgi:hypothetical protein